MSYRNTTVAQLLVGALVSSVVHRVLTVDELLWPEFKNTPFTINVMDYSDSSRRELPSDLQVNEISVDSKHDINKQRREPAINAGRPILNVTRNVQSRLLVLRC